jgi:hypothetical protein
MEEHFAKMERLKPEARTAHAQRSIKGNMLDIGPSDVVLVVVLTLAA